MIVELTGVQFHYFNRSELTIKQVKERLAEKTNHEMFKLRKYPLFFRMVPAIEIKVHAFRGIFGNQLTRVAMVVEVPLFQGVFGCCPAANEQDVCSLMLDGSVYR